MASDSYCVIIVLVASYIKLYIGMQEQYWYQYNTSKWLLKVQEEETIRTVQELKEEVKGQNKQLIVLQLQLEQVSL